jgi:hypothetical protein
MLRLYIFYRDVYTSIYMEYGYNAKRSNCLIIMIVSKKNLEKFLILSPQAFQPELAPRNSQKIPVVRSHLHKPNPSTVDSNRSG